MAHIRKYAESQDRGNHKVLLVVSTNTEFFNITRNHVRGKVDEIVKNDMGIVGESSPIGSGDEIRS